MVEKPALLAHVTHDQADSGDGEEGMEHANAWGVSAVAWWQVLPIAHKLHWLLRLGVVGCYIGHGAYGLLTREAWVPFFGVVGIDRTWAYRLMP
jgi:hypothetical protein